jgi:uncharacterized coiled-coil DUF342 family protein
MNRALTWINLFGVAALAALCVLQWRTNRSLNLEINALQKSGQAQASALAEQDKNLKGLAADLDGFREQVVRAHREARVTAEKLHASERLVAELTAERDQLKDSVVTWSAAVKVRDDRISEANERIRDVGRRLEDAVRKFNDLAVRYNDTVRQLNELTTRYNAAVKELNTARGAASADSPKAS